MIDIHCHLEKKVYKDLNNIIKEIFETEIEKIIVSGYNIATNAEAISLSEQYDNIYVSVGYHPSIADEVTEKDLELLEEQLSYKKVVAVGEIGLDYYWRSDNKTQQLSLFKKQIEIANRNQKPIIVHNRQATEDIYNVLKLSGAKGVLHCYNDSLKMARKFIQLGFLLGIGGIITFKNNNDIREVIKNIPIEYLVFETDSPYLTPEPYRGKQNNPQNIKYIAKKVVEIKGLSYNEVIMKSSTNAKRLFDF